MIIKMKVAVATARRRYGIGGGFPAAVGRSGAGGQDNDNNKQRLQQRRLLGGSTVAAEARWRRGR